MFKMRRVVTPWSNPQPSSQSPPPANFTMRVVRPWRRYAAFGVAAVAAIAAAVGWAVTADDDSPVVAAPTTVSPATTAAIPATTSTTSTTVDPDAGCRAAFVAATTAGTEVTKFATLNACTEDQWLRMQAATPIPAATLAGLCDARYGLPATSCGTADTERVAREQAAARATTTATPTPAPTAPRPVATAAPDTTPTNTPTNVVYQSAGKTPKRSGRIGTGSFTVTGNWTFTPGQIIGDLSSCTSTLTIYKPGYKSSGIAPVPGVGTIVPTGDFSVSGTFTAEINYACPVLNPNELGDTFSWTLGVVN